MNKIIIYWTTKFIYHFIVEVKTTPDVSIKTITTFEHQSLKYLLRWIVKVIFSISETFNHLNSVCVRWILNCEYQHPNNEFATRHFSNISHGWFYRWPRYLTIWIIRNIIWIHLMTLCNTWVSLNYAFFFISACRQNSDCGQNGYCGSGTCKYWTIILNLLNYHISHRSKWHERLKKM